MAKNTNPITLQEIAQELNDVMQYGMNPDTNELEHPEQQINVEQKEKALLADIIKNAKADLRVDDEQSFSQDAWDWFIENKLVPGTEEADEEKAPAKGKEKAPAKDKAPAKEKAPAKSKADDGEEKRGIKKAMVPGGNEAKAVELAKEGCTLEDFVDEYTAIYAAAGNNDKEYAAKRAKIYYKIGYTKAGLTPPDAPKEKAPAKGKAAKEEAPAKGRGRKQEAEEPAEEPQEKAPARGRGRR